LDAAGVKLEDMENMSLDEVKRIAKEQAGVDLEYLSAFENVGDFNGAKQAFLKQTGGTDFK